MAGLRAIVTVPRVAKVGAVLEIRLLAQHPMETGYRVGAEGQPLPRDLLRRVECHFEDERVFAATLHAAIAANPYLAFTLRLPRSGLLRVTWQGDGGLLHSETQHIAAV